MNKCIFFGRLADAPQLHKDENGAHFVKITLVTEEYRRTKDGVRVKEKNYLPMQAWDSAAVTIKNNCNKGDFLIVSTSARSNGGEIVFRINEFRITGGKIETGEPVNTQ